jgi:hypothetical protein
LRMDTKALKDLAIWYGSIALVVVTLPIVFTALDKISGGAVGSIYDATIGEAGRRVSAIGGAPVTAETGIQLTGETGATLVAIN